jgi:hypothetical protein
MKGKDVFFTNSNIVLVDDWQDDVLIELSLI